MELVPITEDYYEFVREMRLHPDNIGGFLEKATITPTQQKEYMQKHEKDYYICLSFNRPVGYVGVIDNDIRICTHPDFKGVGIGSFMLERIVKIYPEATGKILEKNIASQKLFDRCKVPYKLI